MLVRGGVCLAIFLIAAAIGDARQTPVPSSSDWLQWGGPNRTFVSPSTGLAAKWPAAGPRRLWSRALGEGHSSILVDGGRLFTMYRPVSLLSLVWRSQEEVVAALDAATGRTVWEFRYPASTSEIDFSQGAGPHATPLVAGSRLFAVSSRQQLFAFDKATGRRLWSHDLLETFGGKMFHRGTASSPIAYRDRIILGLGGENQAMAAFDQATGRLAWKGGDFAVAGASPILVDVEGETQLVVFGENVVVGLDPNSGRTLWTHPHKTDWGLNISTPIWTAGALFVSSAYGSGSRALELRRSAGKTVVTERWASTRMRVHFGNAIAVGEFVYASSGDFGPAVMTAIDMRSGKVAWQDRSFARAQFVYADNKLIVLDEDGTLGLATVSPQGLTVLARASVLDNVAWTPPTLAGTTLFVRDRKTLSAFNLNANAN